MGDGLVRLGPGLRAGRGWALQHVDPRQVAGAARGQGAAPQPEGAAATELHQPIPQGRRRVVARVVEERCPARHPGPGPRGPRGASRGPALAGPGVSDEGEKGAVHLDPGGPERGLRRAEQHWRELLPRHQRGAKGADLALPLPGWGGIPHSCMFRRFRRVVHAL